MANSVGTRPMVLDTANATPVIKGWIKILSMVFDGYGAAADGADLRNQDGLTIWKPNGNAELEPISQQNVGWVKGLQLQSIAAGAVRIYVG